MRKKIVLSLFLITVFAAGLACSKKEPAQSEQTAQTEMKEVSDTEEDATGDASESAAQGTAQNEAMAAFDPGKLDGNQYSNEALGLSLELPDKWKAATQDELSVLYQNAYEAAGGNDEAFSVLKYLLVAFPEEVESQESIGAINIILEEKTGERTAKKILEIEQSNHQRLVDEGNNTIQIGDITEKNIDGKTLYSLSVEIGEGESKRTQEMYVLESGGYFLEMAFSWVKENDATALRETINSIHFS